MRVFKKFKLLGMSEELRKGDCGRLVLGSWRQQDYLWEASGVMSAALRLKSSSIAGLDEMPCAKILYTCFNLAGIAR